MRRIDLRGGSGEQLTRRAPEEPTEAVRQIIERVRRERDSALLALTEELDGVKLREGSIAVPPEEFEKAAKSVPPDLIEAMEEAERRIRAFAQHQLLMPWKEEIGDALVGEVVHPLERAGIYVPGGRRAYPSTLLMCAVPASVAGVGKVVVCVPPGADGSVATATLAAAHVAGVDELYRVGGAQAIAAMAFGTETIHACDIVVGPGNAYVALAKREAAGTVAIDSVAGPSEIVIVAGSESSGGFIAADLLSQVEHGPGGVSALVTWDPRVADEAEKHVERLLNLHWSVEEKDRAAEALSIALVEDLEQALDVVGDFAPEHVELMFPEAAEVVDSGQVRNCGAIFIGPYSPVPFGDYIAGTNHVLPTGGSARWATGLRASHFQRTTSVVQADEAALRNAERYVAAFAEAEALPFHTNAVNSRFVQDGVDDQG